MGSVDQQFPSAIIYDWDNTIVDTWPVIIRAMNATLMAMGHSSWNDEEAKKRIRKSLRTSFPALFGPSWAKARGIFYEHIRENHLSQLKILHGAEKLINGVSVMGIPQFVLSNKVDSILQSEVQYLGWQRFFSRVVGAEVAPNDKPHTDAVRYTLSGTGIGVSSDVWFVGDTAIDMECAFNSGLFGVAVRPFSDKDQEFDVFLPQLHFDSPEALWTFISSKRQ